jgi:hypothetical protein
MEGIEREERGKEEGWWVNKKRWKREDEEKKEGKRGKREKKQGRKIVRDKENEMREERGYRKKDTEGE